MAKSTFDEQRVFGWRALCDMKKTYKCRQAIEDNLRRATFNPTQDDVMIMFVGVACAFMAVILMMNA